MDNYRVYYRLYNEISGTVNTRERADIPNVTLIKDSNGSIEFVNEHGKVVAGFNCDIWSHYFTYEDEQE